MTKKTSTRDIASSFAYNFICQINEVLGEDVSPTVSQRFFQSENNVFNEVSIFIIQGDFRYGASIISSMKGGDEKITLIPFKQLKKEREIFPTFIDLIESIEESNKEAK